jgi:hypothetical protein
MDLINGGAAITGVALRDESARMLARARLFRHPCVNLPENLFPVMQLSDM